MIDFRQLVRLRFIPSPVPSLWHQNNNDVDITLPLLGCLTRLGSQLQLEHLSFPLPPHGNDLQGAQQDDSLHSSTTLGRLLLSFDTLKELTITPGYGPGHAGRDISSDMISGILKHKALEVLGVTRFTGQLSRDPTPVVSTRTVDMFVAGLPLLKEVSFHCRSTDLVSCQLKALKALRYINPLFHRRIWPTHLVELHSFEL